MKRVKLCDTACIDLTEEQYERVKTIQLISEETGVVKGYAKEIYLVQGIIMLVPLDQFKEMEDKNVQIKSGLMYHGG